MKNITLIIEGIGVVNVVHQECITLHNWCWCDVNGVAPKVSYSTSVVNVVCQECITLDNQCKCFAPNVSYSSSSGAEGGKPGFLLSLGQHMSHL